MMTAAPKLFLRSIPILSAFWLAGCGGEAGEKDDTVPPKAGAADSRDSGKDATIVVDGSSTVFQISKAAAEGFEKTNSEIQVVVNNSGTSGGFGNYIQGEVDIVDASRPAKPKEEEQAKAKKLDWTRFLVGYDGITLVVHKKNDFVKSMTVDQLKALWSPESKITTWKGINPSWPDRKIVLYSPDNASGTFEFFTEAIVGKAKSQRKDVQTNGDDNVLVSGVEGDVDGLAYFGYAYYEAHKDTLNAVAVQAGADARPVLPGPETILDKTYRPLSRPLYIYVKTEAAKRPEVAKFLRYYLGNIKTLAKEGGYVAPTDEDVAANEAAAKPILGTP